MAQTIKLKRGLEANRNNIVPLEGEIITTSDNYELFIGDGVNTGGIEIGYLNKRTGGTVANLTVTGNLTVNGTTTTVNSNDVSIGDAAIILNADLDAATAPSEDGGIIINRGSHDDVSILWDETNDWWAINDGVSSRRLLDVSDNIITSISANSGLFESTGFDDTFSIVGSGTITTTIVGDVLTISADAANSGSLDVTVAEDGISGESVYITTGTGFDADSSTNYTYDIHVGPSLANLADIMSSGVTSGFIKKTGSDTYQLDDSTYDNYVSWGIGGDTGVDINVVSGYTVTFAGGADIETTISANNLDISHSNVTRNNTADTSTIANGGNFDVIDSIVSSATGHITSVNTKTITLPTALEYSQSATTVTNGAGFDLLDSAGLHDVISLLGNVEADGTGVIVERIDADTIRAHVDVIDGGSF